MSTPSTAATTAATATITAANAAIAASQARTGPQPAAADPSADPAADASVASLAPTLQRLRDAWQANKPDYAQRSADLPGGGTRIFAGKTYVALYAVVAFEPYSGNMTKIYLDSGHEILVDLPAHNVRNSMES